MNMHKIQDLASDFLKESELTEIMVMHKEGHPVLIIHLLTDFYKFVKQFNDQELEKKLKK